MMSKVAVWPGRPSCLIGFQLVARSLRYNVNQISDHSVIFLPVEIQAPQVASTALPCFRRASPRMLSRTRASRSRRAALSRIPDLETATSAVLPRAAALGGASIRAIPGFDSASSGEGECGPPGEPMNASAKQPILRREDRAGCPYRCEGAGGHVLLLAIADADLCDEQPNHIAFISHFSMLFVIVCAKVINCT
jgi:hypothetical protein